MALQVQDVHNRVSDLDAGSILFGDILDAPAREAGLRFCLTEVVQSDFKTA